MKIEIKTSAKAIECANAILGQGIKALEERPDLMKQMNFSFTDLKNASAFRKSLIKSFLNGNAND